MAKFDPSKYKFLYLPLSICLAGLLVAIAIFFTGGIKVVGTGTDSGSAAAPTTATVSIASAPTLGDANAPVTILEFTDFECPYCKSFFTDTLPQLKSTYIDTGKAKLTVRNYPLPFHDPAATKEALAALCARGAGRGFRLLLLS